MKKLNIGCGRKILPGYVNLDIVKISGVDVVHNLEKFPYPFKEGEFDVIEAHQVLEHVHNLGAVMKEISRILTKGGRLIVDVPHFTSNSAYKDPTHSQLFAYVTFDFFVKKHYTGEDYDYGTEYFSYIRKRLRFYKGFYIYNYVMEPIINWLIRYKDGQLYEANALRNLFPAWKLEVILIK